MAKTPKSIRVQVEVDAAPEVLFRALRRHWSQGDVIVAALAEVVPADVGATLHEAIKRDGRLSSWHLGEGGPSYASALSQGGRSPGSTPYADEPLRPEQPHPGQRHLDLLESIDPDRGRLIGLLILAILLATIALLLAT